MSEYTTCRACGSTDAYIGLLSGTECPAEGCENFSQRQYDEVYGAVPDAEEAPYVDLGEYLKKAIPQYPIPGYGGPWMGITGW